MIRKGFKKRKEEKFKKQRAHDLWRAKRLQNPTFNVYRVYDENDIVIFKTHSKFEADEQKIKLRGAYITSAPTGVR